MKFSPRQRLPSVRTEQERNVLAGEHLPLVGFAVNRLLRRYRSKRYSRDEAMSDGYLGLLRAAELYDAEKGYQFSTYAFRWIWRFLEMGYRQTLDVVSVPLYRKNRPHSEPMGHLEEWSVPAAGETVIESASRAEERDRVSKALAGLPEREAMVLRLRGTLTLRETARQMGVSHERVRQIEQRALRRAAGKPLSNALYRPPGGVRGDSPRRTPLMEGER